MPSKWRPIFVVVFLNAFSGNLPNASVCLDANGTLYNINLLIYQLYRGFGVGTSVYVGNSIGRKCDLRLAGGMRDVVASFGSLPESASDTDFPVGEGSEIGVAQPVDGDPSFSHAKGSEKRSRDNCHPDGDSDFDDSGVQLDDSLVQAAARDAKLFCWTG